MPSVYVETTIPSYLAALPSNNLVVAAHQLVTHEWWASAHNKLDLFVSELVLREIQQGDSIYASRRMTTVQGIDILKNSSEVERLTKIYFHRLGLSGPDMTDLPHFAYAVAYKMEYLVTWNCSHIANGQIVKKLMTVNRELGLATPLIVTPLELCFEKE